MIINPSDWDNDDTDDPAYWEAVLRYQEVYPVNLHAREDDDEQGTYLEYLYAKPGKYDDQETATLRFVCIRER